MGDVAEEVGELKLVQEAVAMIKNVDIEKIRENFPKIMETITFLMQQMPKDVCSFQKIAGRGSRGKLKHLIELASKVNQSLRVIHACSIEFNERISDDLDFFLMPNWQKLCGLSEATTRTGQKLCNDVTMQTAFKKVAHELRTCGTFNQYANKAVEAASASSSGSSSSSWGAASSALGTASASDAAEGMPRRLSYKQNKIWRQQENLRSTGEMAIGFASTKALKQVLGVDDAGLNSLMRSRTTATGSTDVEEGTGTGTGSQQLSASQTEVLTVTQSQSSQSSKTTSPTQEARNHSPEAHEAHVVDATSPTEEPLLKEPVPEKEAEKTMLPSVSTVSLKMDSLEIMDEVNLQAASEDQDQVVSEESCTPSGIQVKGVMSRCGSHTGTPGPEGDTVEGIATVKGSSIGNFESVESKEGAAQVAHHKEGAHSAVAASPVDTDMQVFPPGAVVSDNPEAMATMYTIASSPGGSATTPADLISSKDLLQKEPPANPTLDPSDASNPCPDFVPGGAVLVITHSKS